LNELKIEICQLSIKHVMSSASGGLCPLEPVPYYFYYQIDIRV